MVEPSKLGSTSISIETNRWHNASGSFFSRAVRRAT
jgi:hypothetical protein